ncbi:hypothetical protein IMSAGC013_03829 [Lachnospiraceae bacterium]|nr:hypothetical protein IMSAGC013_03829 [Lachnospiraceae bacterium]
MAKRCGTLRFITVLSGRLIKYRNYGEYAIYGSSPKDYP